jgi:hypothetical protein
MGHIGCHPEPVERLDTSISSSLALHFDKLCVTSGKCSQGSGHIELKKRHNITPLRLIIRRFASSNASCGRLLVHS